MQLLVWFIFKLRDFIEILILTGWLFISSLWYDKEEVSKTFQFDAWENNSCLMHVISIQLFPIKQSNVGGESIALPIQTTYCLRANFQVLGLFCQLWDLTINQSLHLHQHITEDFSFESMIEFYSWSENDLLQTDQ